MKRFLILSAVLLVCSAAKVIAQQYIFMQRFESANKAYIADVSYTKADGSGKAYYIVKKSDSTIVSQFKAEMEPGEVMLPEDGNRIVAFGGYIGEDVPYLYKLAFYSINGKILKYYESAKKLLHGIGRTCFTPDSKYFIMACSYDLADYLKFKDINNMKRGRVLDIFEMKTGKLVKQYSIEGFGADIILSSNDAKWILLSGDNGRNGDQSIALIDGSTGNISWYRVEPCKIMEVPLRANSMSEDGSEFTVTWKHKRISYVNNNNAVTLKNVDDE